MVLANFLQVLSNLLPNFLSTFPRALADMLAKKLPNFFPMLTNLR